MESTIPASAAPQGARAIVRRHLDAATRASGRLGDPADAEALHDCRVAIRRLRVTLKAYAPLLKPGVPKGIRKALGALADHTGPARDAEVFVAWLERRLRRLSGPARTEAEWLRTEMARRRDVEYRKLRRLIPRVLGILGPLLRTGLSVAHRKHPGGENFRQFTARCVDGQIREFCEALSKVRGPGDHDRVHRARIAAKKVPYLMEAALTTRGGGVLKAFRRVQELLGNYHDLAGVKVQVARARRVRAAGAAPHQGPRPGLTAILVIADREERMLFRRIQRELLTGPPPCLAPVRRWVARHTPQRPANPLPEAG
jgi:CHAD domain-containing protein